MAHIGHAGLQEVIKTAGHQMAFQNFGAGLDGGLEVVHHVVHGAVQQDLDEHQHRSTQLVGVQPRLIAQDVALAREALHPLQHRGG